MAKNIAIMAGGNSSEYEISLGSANQIEKIIDKTKYNPFKIFVKGRRWFYADGQNNEYEIDKNDFSITVNEKKIRLEYALILIHGTPGEDGLLQAYFDLVGIPYSSSGFLTSAVTFDKSLCKKAVSHSGVNLAREILVRKDEKVDTEAIVRTLDLPIFVKPNASGSSCGVTKVKNTEEIEIAVNKALKESDSVIIEEFIDGTEVSCGVMVAGGKEYVFPITEIVSKKEFFDYEAKYTGGMSDEITPARIPEDTKALLNKYTLDIYKILGCRGIARIDFIIKNRVPYMIEINTVPGMSEGSIIPKQAKEMGMGMTELFNIIIEDTSK